MPTPPDPRSALPAVGATDARRAVAGFVTLYAAIGALSPYLPVYYESLGLGLDTIGLLAALYAGAAMVGAPAWGAAADRLGESHPVMAIAAGAAAVASVALGVVDGVLPIAIAALALAVTMSGVMPILDARALEISAARRSDYASMRVWGSGAYIGGVLLTGWVAAQLGPEAMFVVLAPTLVVTAIIGLGIRSRPPSPAVSRRQVLGAVLRDRRLVPFLAVVLLTWTASTTINAFFSIHLVDVGAPSWLVGVSWAIGAAVEIPLMLGFGRLLRRVGLDRLLLAGAALFVLRAAAVVVTDEPLVIAVSMLLHGGALALFLVGAVTYVGRHAPAGAATTAQGVLTATVFGLAQVLGPGIGGLAAGSLGLRAMFLGAGVLSLVALGTLAWLLARSSEPAAAASSGPVA
ncbi:MAG TPA: MFS transporter [Candidatus Limnocylindria bacterium]|nr:MFS transporter [Candidatus Limnocylindria bacterium]